MKVVRWFAPVAAFLALELLREYRLLTALGVKPGEGLRNVWDELDRRYPDGNKGAERP